MASASLPGWPGALAALVAFCALGVAADCRAEEPVAPPAGVEGPAEEEDEAQDEAEVEAEAEAEVQAEAEAEAPPESPAKLRMMCELLKLRGRGYREARDTAVRTVKEEEILAVREAAGEDSALKLACDALVWRMRNTQIARLLDKHGPAPAPAGASSSSGESGLWSDHNSARTLISCFGADALPAMAEHLLYEDRPEAYRLCLIETLVELRDARAPGVLLAAAGDGRNDERVRSAAVWRLEKCLSGLPPLTMAYAAGRGPAGLGPKVIPELAELARPVKLPALALEGAEREGLVAELGELLGHDRSDRVRALAARALRNGGAGGLPALSRSVVSDPSPWVRAWCADSLRRLASADAKRELQAARAAEKDGEVRAVMDGRSQPALPEQGVPGKSILKVGS